MLDDLLLARRGADDLVRARIDLGLAVLGGRDDLTIDADLGARLGRFELHRRDLRRDRDRVILGGALVLGEVRLGGRGLRLAEPVDRLGELAEHLVAEAEVEHRAGRARIELDRGLELLARTLRVLLDGQELAAFSE